MLLGNPHVSKSSGVNHTTSVSRPQLKCYQVKDKVVPNNSQVKFKKKELEDHHRISSISKKTKSVTACDDSSKSRIWNVNVVCVECGKFASDTTIQKSKSYYKKLYENTNQEWKWWIAKRCPSVYTWTQKPLRTKKIWMPKIRKDDESTTDQASVFIGMMSVHISSGLVLHQMTSDHNRSELGIQDHSNEPSSSKLVPKVVPLAVKTATSRQELELLFHHHIAMPRTTDTPVPIPQEVCMLSKEYRARHKSGSLCGVRRANRHHGPSDAMAQPFPAIRVSLNRNLSHLSRRYTRYLLTSHSEIVDIE
ncbi:hypothetical protein Tco_0540315 [Tanacetum coccineum]